jgi:hypothetical protein
LDETLLNDHEALPEGISKSGSGARRILEAATARPVTDKMEL